MKIGRPVVSSLSSCPEDARIDVIILSPSSELCRHDSAGGHRRHARLARARGFRHFTHYEVMKPIARRATTWPLPSSPMGMTPHCPSVKFTLGKRCRKPLECERTNRRENTHESSHVVRLRLCARAHKRKLQRTNKHVSLCKSNEHVPLRPSSPVHPIAGLLPQKVDVQCTSSSPLSLSMDMLPLGTRSRERHADTRNWAFAFSNSLTRSESRSK